MICVHFSKFSIIHRLPEGNYCVCQRCIRYEYLKRRVDPMFLFVGCMSNRTRNLYCARTKFAIYLFLVEDLDSLYPHFYKKKCLRSSKTIRLILPVLTIFVVVQIYTQFRHCWPCLYHLIMDHFNSMLFPIYNFCKCKSYNNFLQSLSSRRLSLRGYPAFVQCPSALLITAMHGMQTRYSDENSVRPSVRLSVRPSVRHTRELWQNGKKICPDLYTIWKNI